MTESISDWLKHGRRVLESQPFSQLLGTEVVALEPGKAELAINIVHDLKQQHGFVHGGVLSYLADNALTYAGGLALGGPAVTSEMKINYVRPAIGERLVARAEALHTGKSQSVCRCDVFVIKDGQEKLCAVAQGTIAAMSQAKT
jgi:uncharacterized protein (TIGR00369 family)